MKHYLNLSELREHFLESYFRFYPTFGSTLGLHQYDSQLEEYSQTSRNAYVEALRGFATSLEHDFGEGHGAILDEAGQLELRILQWKISDEIFRFTEYRDFEWNPMVYSDQLELSPLLDRDFAPLSERVSASLLRIRRYPSALAVARQNLRAELDRTIVEISIAAFQGRIEQLDELSHDQVAQVSDSRLQAELREAIATAKISIQEFVVAMEEVVLPKSMYDSFRLGPELMEKFVHSAELIDEPLEELLRRGEQELERLSTRLHQVCEKLDPALSPEEIFSTYLEEDYFSEQTILSSTTALLERIRSFLIEHDVITIPSEVRCLVRETPASMRWAFAAMNSPGAFEEIATEAFYYVTLPDPSWDEARRKDYLKALNRSVLEIISIHEAYPGHYVHFLHLKHVQSRLGKSLWSYAFIEGWAHYTEEMMIELGYGGADARLEIAFLQEALIRVCRYLASIKLHSRMITLSEAQHLFESYAYMKPVAAKKEAERGVFDPGYLFYTLGKLQIQNLRNTLEVEHRKDNTPFSMRQFHDELLSYGSIPVKLIAEVMV